MLSDVRLLRDEMTEHFDQFETRLEKIESKIAEEGETTRRHFNIMVEKVEAAVKIVAEVNAHLPSFSMITRRD